MRSFVKKRGFVPIMQNFVRKASFCDPVFAQHVYPRLDGHVLWQNHTIQIKPEMVSPFRTLAPLMTMK